MTGGARCSTVVAAAIATRDRSAGVARCLDALLAGAMLPAEIVVVDQSMSDSTRMLIAAVSDPPVRVHYVAQHATGLSASRNAAIRTTTAPVLAMTDDDCVPDENWIAAIDEAIRAMPDAAAVTGRILPLATQERGTQPVSLRTATSARAYAGRAVPWLVGSGGNTAVAVAWCRRVGGFDERLGTGSPGGAAEDADLFYRLLRAGATICYEPAAIVFHQRQPWAARLASRRRYGYGIGAFTGIWLRRHDVFPARCFAGWLGTQAVNLATAVVHRDWPLARQRQLSLSGAVHGLVYGLRAPEPSRSASGW